MVERGYTGWLLNPFSLPFVVFCPLWACHACWAEPRMGGQVWAEEIASRQDYHLRGIH